MGQYKVPQNVEAEDKILGPLTFKEFIYFLIGFGWLMVTFMMFKFFLPLFIIIGVPPALLFLLLAFYHRDGQDFEHILVAAIRFFATNRRRIWTKDDAIQTFHVEAAPVTAEISQRNPAQVRSELEKLARLVDSRGWNHPPEPEFNNVVMPSTPNADRIVPATSVNFVPDPVDMLDMQKNQRAQNLSELLNAAANDVRAEAMQQMTHQAVFTPSPIIQAQQSLATPGISGVTGPAPSNILKLATQSDELKVSQLAAQATRATLPNGQTLEVPNSGS